MGLDRIKQRSKHAVLFLHKNKVVTFVEERDEAQPKLVGSRPQTEGHVGLAALHQPSAFRVGADGIRVAEDAFGGNGLDDPTQTPLDG